MGYYANYSGAMRLNEKPPENIISDFNDYFENVYCDDDTLDFGGYDKYNEEAVYELTEKIKPYTQSGEINYQGDDGCQWRFIFRDGLWLEQNGTVVYETSTIEENMQSEFIGQIIDIFDDAIDPDKPTFTGKIFDNVFENLKQLMKGWRVF